MDAALDQLVSKGVLAGLNLREVADDVGVTPANIYYWFGSRQELLRAALARETRRLEEPVAEAAADGFVARRLRMFDAIAETRPLTLTALLALDGDPGYQPLPYLDATLDHYRALVEAGELPPDLDADAAHLVSLATSIGIAIYAEAAARQLGIDADEVRARARAVFAPDARLAGRHERRRGHPNPMSGSGVAPAGRPTVPPAVADEIRRHGAVPLDRVLERALYDPDAGFYETGGRAGRPRGDFLTSPEVGRLFGAVVARALDAWWRRPGQPDPFVVVEAGAGPGTLCRTVLAAGARVRRRPALRAGGAVGGAAPPARREAPPGGPGARLRPGRPRHRVAGRRRARRPDLRQPGRAAPHRRAGRGPGQRAARQPAVRAGPAAPRRLARGAGRPRHGRRRRARLRELLVPLGTERAAVLDRLAPDAADGARVPLQDAARAWLREALAVAGPRGRVVVVDYAATTAELAARPPGEWLRTYRAHARGGGPLDDLGRQDVTCEVALDQLALVRPPSTVTTQADWLRAYGLDDLVADRSGHVGRACPRRRPRRPGGAAAG